MSAHVVGVDPGPVPGIASLLIGRGRLTEVVVAQVSAELLPDVLRTLLERHRVRTVIQVETFVVGKRSMRSGAAGAVTRDLVGQAAQTVIEFGRSRPDHAVHYAQRTASQVKPWATDARLVAAGLSSRCSGMRHARDAARHALWAAVHDAGLPDPLSKEWKR